MKRMRLFLLSFLSFLFAMTVVLTVQLLHIRSIAVTLGIPEKADAFHNLFLGQEIFFLLLVVVVFSVIQFILFLILVVTRNKDFSVNFFDKLSALRKEHDPDATYDRALEVYKSLITDPETGSIIYKHFHEILEKEFVRSSRYSVSFSLMRIVVRNKDNYQDFHKKAGSNIQSVLRNVDVVSVNESGEFICLLPNTKKANADLAAERIFKRLKTYQELTGEKILLNIGIATFPDDGAELENILEELDKNFQKAMLLGDNKVYF